MKATGYWCPILALVFGVHIGSPAWGASGSLEVTGVARRLSLMPIGELTPRSIDAPGVTIHCGLYVGGLRPWVGATLGGNWHKVHGRDFAARLSYVDWTMKSGVGRQAPWGGVLLETSIYYEYGEAHSWLENMILSESGPRTIHTGGGLQVMVAANHGLLRPMFVIDVGVYRAHSNDETNATEATWIGSEGSIRAGVQLVR
jgi:hypothetical protein